VDLSVLPTLYGLIVFVGCFRPLVRRAGPTGTGLAGSLIQLLLLWSVDICALCFLWAASNGRVTRFNRIFILELAVPVLLQSGLLIFDVQSRWLRLTATLLLMAPAVHLLVWPRYRTIVFNRLAVAFAILAALIAVFYKADPYLISGILLGAIFLSTAYLCFVHATRISRGIVVMIAGLVLWAITCPLQSLDVLEAGAAIGRAILDMPRYLLAAGMILFFLDEYVTRTERLALHDPLTGLPNRRMFERRLDQAIEESRRTFTPVACLVIDVDDFKYINDTYGHPVGDGLLQALAKRLSWNLGPRDLLARTGGDEFTAVLVEAADEYHVRFIAGAMMAAGCVPVSIHQHSIDVHISIGIAVSPQDAGDSNSLHKAADDAMYLAKRRGGGLVAFANEEAPQIHAV
jgi:diguanylate cyclase (GGDEF)-like protein